jgi:hypothetical protein
LGLDSFLGFFSRNPISIAVLTGLFIVIWQVSLSRRQARAAQAKEDGTWTPESESRQAWWLLLVYCVGIGLFLVWLLGFKP